MKKQMLKLLFLGLLAININGQVVINEFMADNASTNPDMVDFDDFSDWIELYNNGSESIDLTGYYLTDNLNNPLKWAVPFGTVINANSYLLIWADGNSAGIGESFPRGYWPWDDFTTKRIHADFKLSSNGEEVGLYKTDNAAITDLIKKGDSWKYLDDGSDQGTAWSARDFDDSSWKTGNAKFGYGDNNETTTLSYGENSNDKYLTYYFRKEFSVPQSSLYDSVFVKLLRDDGAIVYVNGNEIIRSNMPTGDIDYQTRSESGVSGSDESIYFNYSFSSSILNEGINIIAVEVHQTSPTSSDLGFDLEMTANLSDNSPFITLVDSVIFSRQLPDVSMGRLKSNPNAWAYFTESTPGGENNTPIVDELIYPDEVSFSLESGFYNGTQQLSLTSRSSKIYYTTDGSIPTSKSTLYNQPISISKNTVVSARAIVDNKLDGPIDTKSYFISENDYSLPVISLVSDPTFLWDNELGIYINSYKQKEIPTVVEYFNKDGNFEFNVKAGARIGGLNIWRFDQKPLNIYMRNKYGDEAIKYKLFEHKPIGTFTAIRLRNGGDNWATTMLTDAMSESLLDGQMNNGVQAYSPSVVFINGEYWGIHNIREKNDEQYFVSNFGADPNSMTHLEYNFLPPYGDFGMNAIIGDITEYQDFLSFVSNEDVSNLENYEYIKSQMDVDNYINFIIAELYVCNTSFRHNREWWRSGKPGGKWTWLLPDIDRGFNYGNINRNLISDVLNNAPLLNSLLENQEFHDKFIQTFAAHLNSTFSPSRINAIVDSLSGILLPEMPRHINRWKDSGGIQSIDSWNNQLNRIKYFANERADIMFDHLRSSFNLPETSNITIQSDNPKAAKILVNNVPMTDNTKPLRFFNNIQISVKAVPVEGYKFAGWKDLSSSDSISVTFNNDITLYPQFIKDETLEIPSEINGSVTLKEISVYYSVKDIIVNPNAVLKIEKGTEIRMAKSSSILVKGKLVANGTPNQPIIIRANKETGVESWGAICFDNAADTSYLNFVNISGATLGSDPINQMGGISSINSNIVMNGLNIENVLYPIFVRDGSAVLRNSSIRTDVTCDFINIKYGNGLVENNVFFGNKSPDTDAIDFDGVSNGIIKNNKFYNFNGFNCDAIDIGEGAENIQIYGNLIYNSQDKGISVGQQSSVVVERNVIIGCNMGIAVKDISTAVVTNNTFFMNDYSIACFEKNYGNGGGTAIVSNSIISGSRISPLFIDSLSSIDISYSLSDTEPLDGDNNLYVLPSFNDPLNYNVSLHGYSAAINAGDPSFGSDPDGSAPDMGAYYYYSGEDYPISLRDTLSSAIVVNEIMYNDGSVNSGDWIELYNSSSKAVDLSGWSVMDETSSHQFFIRQGTILQAGGYLVICRDSSNFSDAYPSVNNFIGGLNFGFDGNDRILITKEDGSVVISVDYDNSEPWPDNVDGTGYSLELTYSKLINNSPFSWKSSTVENGTPGKENSVYDPTDIKDDALASEFPNDYRLYQNYPNPFNPTTAIKYHIPKAGNVSLKIYNLLGQVVKTLVNESKNAGIYQVNWNGKNDFGIDVSSGVYIYRLESGNYINSMKMVFLK